MALDSSAAPTAAAARPRDEAGARPRDERSFAIAVRDIVLFSIAFGTTAALLASLMSALGVWDWLYAFAMIRWIGIMVLIGLTIAAKIARISPPGPAVMWSTITPLVLTIESIAVDIVLARMH